MKSSKKATGSSEPLFAAGDHDRIKTGFNHFSDLFSEFTKHISPAFNHERPDRSVQMRLYTMHKGQHLLIFIMFLCLFAIAMLMGVAGPRIIVEHKEKASLLKGAGNKTSQLPGNYFMYLLAQLSEEIAKKFSIKA